MAKSQIDQMNNMNINMNMDMNNMGDELNENFINKNINSKK